MPDVDPRWLELKAKLKKISDNLEVAKRAHTAAAADPTTRDAADKALMTAIGEAVTSINQIVDTPPGTFPAING